MKNFIRKLFTKRPLEEILVFLLARSTDNYLLTRIRPSNNLYSTPAMRTCTREGIHYYLDISDYQNWLIYFNSNADSSLGVLNYINAGDIVFDVGGNIGQTALTLSKKLAGKGMIYSFEPYPATYDKLMGNLLLNPELHKNIKPINSGMGEKPAMLKMIKHSKSNSGSNRILGSNVPMSNELTEVTVSTIDIFVESNSIQRVDLIKIDVEGFEMQVLKGAMNTLLSCRPKLFIELNDSSLKEQGSSSAELVDLLKGLGYSILEDGKSEELKDDIHRHMDIVCKYARV